MGFLGQLISLVRIFQSPLRMPSDITLISYFVMLCGCAVGVCCQFVLLSRSAVCLVHV